MSQAATKKSKGIITQVEELAPEQNRKRTEERRRWFEEGRCPYCGELGDFVGGAPVCSAHGPYPFVPKIVEDEGLDEREMLPDED